MSVYVTVGTTSFDSLIQALDNAEVAAVLKESGYKTLTMQIGRGSYIPTVLPTVKDFDFSFYTFKPSIQEDMTSADLIISHAGAGSIMESLRIGKPLIVVVNEALMDNHQIELAKAMQGQGYLRFCHVPGLLEELKANEERRIASYVKPYPQVDYDIFPALVDEQMGFS